MKSIRNWLGIAMMVMASVYGARILWASSVGHSAVIELTETYGTKTSFEWYQHQPARDLFHGELMEVAVILYYASGLSAATAIVGLLGFCLGIRGARGRLRALSIVCAMAFAVIIVLPWILHGNATRIVGHVVE